MLFCCAAKPRGEKLKIFSPSYNHYNAWALLRKSGKRAPRDFPMPDPEEEAQERGDQKARMAELERQFRAGEIGYEDYVRRRMDIISER